jgi:signal transduction histidine kinase/CheY-like chemotaxis protein/HPt (histidine-containing phosphotransfer) domain-containing protein
MGPGLAFQPYPTMLAVAAIVSLLLAARSILGTKRELAASVVIFHACVFLWCLFRLLLWIAPAQVIRVDAFRLQFIGIVFIPGAVHMYARALVFRPIGALRSFFSLLPGLFFLAMALTNGHHHLFWVEYEGARLPVNPRGGIGFYGFLGYAYILVSLAFATIAREAIRARGIMRRLLRLLLLAFILPFSTNVIFVLAFFGKSAHDPTPVLFAVSGGLLAWIMSRFDFLDVVPYAKRFVLESLGTPLIVVDSENVVVGANGEARRVFAPGRPLEGLGLSDLAPGLALPGAGNESIEWSWGGVDYFVLSREVKGGRGPWSARLYIFRDISALVAVRRELIEAKARADAANQDKSAFVATVSHELRNPLGSIIGLADLDLKLGPPPAIRDDLEVIVATGNMLLGLVNDLLDLSKIEAGRMELESVDFDLHEKVVSVLRAFKAGAEKKGVYLDLAIEEGTPRYLRGDPLRYGQVLMNLVSNAIKFTENGAVTVSLAPEPPRAGDLDGRLVVRTLVRDTGIGISADKIPLLFKEFSQADPSISRRFGGSGLGLSISKKLVSLFGGEVGVESRDGEGSAFSFTAVFCPAESSLREALPEAGEIGAAPRLRVLVVEDDPVNAAVARRYIERRGHGCEVAASGAEAVALASGADLVLVDLGLPDMDGFEAARRIRAETAALPGGEPPVAAMTARMDAGIRTECAEAGMIDCISKPIDVGALDRVLARAADEYRKLGPRAAASIVPARGRSGLGALEAGAPEPGTPLVDRDALLERLEGDEAFMRELLGIFVAEGRARLERFRGAAGEGNIYSLQKQAHSLKGSALSLCAKPLGAAANALELACIAARRAGTESQAALPSIAASVEELCELHEATRDEARALAGAQP